MKACQVTGRCSVWMNCSLLILQPPQCHRQSIYLPNGLILLETHRTRQHFHYKYNINSFQREKINEVKNKYNNETELLLCEFIDSLNKFSLHCWVISKWYRSPTDWKCVNPCCHWPFKINKFINSNALSNLKSTFRADEVYSLVNVVYVIIFP